MIALLSLAIPLGVHASAGTKAALAAMHLIARTAFVGGHGPGHNSPPPAPSQQPSSPAYDKAA